MTVSLFHARLLAAALALVLLGLWELLVRQWGLSALVLPAPSAIAASLWTGLATGYFWPHIWATLQALLLGLAAGQPARAGQRNGNNRQAAPGPLGRKSGCRQSHGR